MYSGMSLVLFLPPAHTLSMRDNRKTKAKYTVSPSGIIYGEKSYSYKKSNL